MKPDFSRCDEDLLKLPDQVAQTLLGKSPKFRADRVMLVGAHCRDVIHSALGHQEDLALTRDLDIGLAIFDSGDYEEIVGGLTPSGDSGIRFMIDDVPTDLMPFGDVEDPVGTVTPRSRGESLSVGAFSEVCAGSIPLELPSGVEIQIPTVEGYAALKLAAWLDRHVNWEFKDARDLARCVYWYAESDDVESLLFETRIDVLSKYDMDLRQASAYILGSEIADHIGPQRVNELMDRWPGSLDHLVTEFILDTDDAWPNEVGRRAILAALESGWRSVAPPGPVDHDPA